MANVYIVQEVQGRNVMAARTYGDLKVLLPPGDVVLSSGPTTRRLHLALKDFSDADYLLCMGDPTAIGISCAVAAKMNRGKFKLLKWDRQQYVYYPIQVDLYPERENKQQ